MDSEIENGEQSATSDNDDDDARYEMKSKLENGEFSSNWLVYDNESQSEKVLKRFILSNSKDFSHFLNEKIETMQLAFDHPNLLTIEDFFEDDDDDDDEDEGGGGGGGEKFRDQIFCIIVEHCPGGTLEHAIRRMHGEESYLPEAKLKRWCYQLVEAVEHLHEENYCHENITSKNVYLNENKTKLKLGLMKIPKEVFAPRSRPKPMVANCLAPPDKIYTMRTDIWCLGALFYEMANLTKPVSQEFTSTYRGVVKSEYTTGDDGGRPTSNSTTTATTNNRYGSDFMELVNKMMQTESDLRPTIWQVSANRFFSKLIHKQQKTMEIEKQKPVEPEVKQKEKEHDENKQPDTLNQQSFNRQLTEEAKLSNGQKSIEKDNAKVEEIFVEPTANDRQVFDLSKLTPGILLQEVEFGNLDGIRNFQRSYDGNLLLKDSPKKHKVWKMIPDGNIDGDLKRGVLSTVKTGDHPLHRAVRCRQFEIVKFFVEEPMRVSTDVRNNRGALPIHIASAVGDLKIFKYFYKRQPSSLTATVSQMPGAVCKVFESVDNLLKLKGNATTSIHLAAERAHLELVRFIINEKRNLMNAKDEHGNSPLCRTVSSLIISEDESVEMAKCLINEFGCDTRQMGYKQLTPLNMAAERGRLKLVQLLTNHLMNHQDALVALLLGAKMNHIEIVQFFWNHYPGLVKSRDEHGNSALNSAARGGALETTIYLVEQCGFRDLIENKGHKGRTPLLEASARGHLPVVRYLLANGANLLSVDRRNKNSALHLAMFKGQKDVADYLHKVDVEQDAGEPLANMKNANGETAAQFAIHGAQGPLFPKKRFSGRPKMDPIISFVTMV